MPAAVRAAAALGPMPDELGQVVGGSRRRLPRAAAVPTAASAATANRRGLGGGGLLGVPLLDLDLVVRDGLLAAELLGRRDDERSGARAALSAGSVLWKSIAFSSLIACSTSPIEPDQLPSYWTNRALLPFSISSATSFMNLSLMPVSWILPRRPPRTPPAAPPTTAPAGPSDDRADDDADRARPDAALQRAAVLGLVDLDPAALRPVDDRRVDDLDVVSTSSIFSMLSRRLFAAAPLSSTKTARVSGACS